MDRRLKSSGWMGKLNKANVEIHARSVFLQGLLLMPAEKRPNSFERWNDLWALWDAWLNKQGINALEAALGFVVAEDLIDRVIVGVDTLQQLVQVISAVDSAPVRSVPDELSITDQDLINPSNW